jgi:hypothetical protein
MGLERGQRKKAILENRGVLTFSLKITIVPLTLIMHVLDTKDGIIVVLYVIEL